MKKFVRLLLAAVLAFSAFSVTLGCSPDKDKDKTEAQNEIMLVDFESYAPDFAMCRVSGDFGKVSVNTDANYVKTGTRSARIDPVGNGWMYFATYSETYNIDYTDFTDVEIVRIEVFNPQKEEKKVSAGLVASYASIENIDRACEQKFTLKSGWNTLDVKVEPSLYEISGDITDCQGVFMSFERDNSFLITDSSAHYYADSVKLIKRGEGISTSGKVEFDEGEILDFERPYQEGFIINDFGLEMSVVKAADYGIDARSGRNVLRMVIPAGNTGSWNYYLKISSPVLKAGALGKLTDEQFGKAYFVWDTFNKTEEFNCVGLFFVGSSSTNYQVGSLPKTNKWTTHRIKLSDIEAHIPGWRENMGQFLFSIKDSSNNDREIFFDNFRVEISD